jgi:hypothetical protein
MNHSEPFHFFAEHRLIQLTGIIARKKEIGRAWPWCCPINVSTSDARARMSIPQCVVALSIDPLSDKDRELEKSHVTRGSFWRVAGRVMIPRAARSCGSEWETRDTRTSCSLWITGARTP